MTRQHLVQGVRPMIHHERIGDRIKAWRRRRGGMSQQVLAGLAGLSQTYISDIETGRKPLDRRSTQVAIALALNVSVAQLIGQADRADPMLDSARIHVPAIRTILVEMSAGERRTPTRDRDQVRAAVREASELRNAADYAHAAAVLPTLLADVAGHGPDMAAETIEALFAAQFALGRMGYPDLARDAAEIGVRVAQEQQDEPAWLGAAMFSWAQSFPPESAQVGWRITTRTAGELQAAGDRGAREVYGRLHLLAGLGAAVDTRADDARAHLDEAAQMARALGEPAQYGSLSAGFTASWFGPTQVDYWRMAVAAELGDTAEALRISDRIDLTAVPVPNRHVYYWTDLARALAAGGGDREAMHALARAERAAPQHFRFNPVVRDLVQTLIGRAKRKAVAGEMEALARKLGIDVI